MYEARSGVMQPLHRPDLIPQRRQLLSRRSCPYPLGNYAQPVPSPHHRCHQEEYYSPNRSTPKSHVETQNVSWFSRRSPLRSPLSDSSPPGGGYRNISLWSNSSIEERMEADEEDDCVITNVTNSYPLHPVKPKEEPAVSLMDSFMESLSFGRAQSNAPVKKDSPSPRKHQSVFDYVPQVGAGSIEIENSLYGCDMSARRVGRSRSMYVESPQRPLFRDLGLEQDSFSSAVDGTISLPGRHLAPSRANTESVLRRRSDFVSDRSSSLGESIPETTQQESDASKEETVQRKGCCAWMMFVVYKIFLFIIKLVFLILLVLGSVILLRHGYLAYQAYAASNCQYYASLNQTQLELSLRKNVFGQHLVLNRITSVFDKHFSSLTPQHPLVLSFHGWTGIGKNFVSEIIAEQVRSASVHKIIIPLHFPHSNEGEIFGQQMAEWIFSNISSCSVNLFIIDEVDKASWDIWPSLESILTRLREESPPDSKVIILLLSNTRSIWINQFTFSWLTSGKPREDIPEEELISGLLQEDSEDSEDWHIQLHQQGLIDNFLIFLPLEKSHVERCIEQDLLLKKRPVTPTLVQHIVESVTFIPSRNPVFSQTGCRKVTATVDVTLE